MCARISPYRRIEQAHCIPCAFRLRSTPRSLQGLLPSKLYQAIRRVRQRMVVEVLSCTALFSTLKHTLYCRGRMGWLHDLPLRGQLFYAIERILCIRSAILKDDQDRMGPTVVGCVTYIIIRPRNQTILVPCGNRRSLASELSPALPLQKLYM